MRETKVHIVSAARVLQNAEDFALVQRDGAAVAGLEEHSAARVKRYRKCEADTVGHGERVHKERDKWPDSTGGPVGETARQTNIVDLDYER